MRNEYNSPGSSPGLFVSDSLVSDQVMICPSCGHANLPGSDTCSRCMFDLAPLDGPVPADRVEGSLMTDPVAVLNPKLPATVDASSDLATVVRMMIERGVGAVLVTINERELAGILTDRDFLTKVAGRSGFEGLPVREFMTPNPETVSLTDPLAFAVRKMAAGGYRHLPVVVDKKAVGLISIRDVLQHVTTLCRDV